MALWRATVVMASGMHAWGGRGIARVVVLKGLTA